MFCIHFALCRQKSACEKCPVWEPTLPWLLQVSRHRNFCIFRLWDKADAVWLSLFSMSMGQAVQFLPDLRGRNSSVRVLYPQIQTAWQHIPWGSFALANWQSVAILLVLFFKTHWPGRTSGYVPNLSSVSWHSWDYPRLVLIMQKTKTKSSNYYSLSSVDRIASFPLYRRGPVLMICPQRQIKLRGFKIYFKGIYYIISETFCESFTGSTCASIRRQAPRHPCRFKDNLWLMK